MKGIFNMACALITMGVDAPCGCEAGHVLHIDATVLSAPMRNNLRCDVSELISGPWYLTISDKPICIGDDGNDSDITLNKSEDPPENEEVSND